VQQPLSRHEQKQPDAVQNKLAFNYWKLGIKVGPWSTSFDIKKGDKDAP
jgi:hypothetical protein